MGAGAPLRGAGGWAMNWLYFVGGCLSLLLLAYLGVALLLPEKFS